MTAGTPPGADALWFLNALARIHLAGAQVGGHVGVMEFSAPPGDMPPLHRHQREDELFLVIEGRLALHQPGLRSEAGRGEFIFAQRGVAHTYEILGDRPARFVVLATPAGLEEFVQAVARPAQSLCLPEPSDPDPEKMAALAGLFGIQLLGPPGTLP